MFKNKALLLAISWLIIVNFIGLIAVNRFNLGADNAYRWIPVEKYDQHQSWNVVNIHSRWDSNWYQDLVKKGYERNANDTLSNLVFFPLYPLLMKVVSIFTMGNLVLAGWIVSSLFLLLSCVLLFKFVKKFHKEADPIQAVFLLLIFPTAFFLNAVYTESLFLFLSLATFYFAFEKKYFWAGVVGFLASLTRVSGILLFLPILLQFIITEGYDFRVLKKSWPLMFIPLGTALFFIYHWIYFGDPFLFFRIESAWGRSFSLNTDHFILFSRASVANFSLDIFYLLFGIFIISHLLKLKKYPYALYVASTIGVAVASGTLMSIGRYVLVLFPIYIVGASIKNEITKYLWIIISAMLMALNTYLFVNWYWAG
jgi:Gpi18-like mannosyltransferase